MIEIKCRLCDNWRTKDEIGIAVALYNFHCIRDHWDMMVKAHDNPSMLNAALAMAVMV